MGAIQELRDNYEQFSPRCAPMSKLPN